jgi:hypothetical protein
LESFHLFALPYALASITFVIQPDSGPHATLERLGLAPGLLNTFDYSAPAILGNDWLTTQRSLGMFWDLRQIKSPI